MFLMSISGIVAVGDFGSFVQATVSVQVNHMGHIIESNGTVGLGDGEEFEELQLLRANHEDVLLNQIAATATVHEVGVLLMQLPNSTMWQNLADKVKESLVAGLKSGHDGDQLWAQRLFSDYVTCETQFAMSQIVVDEMSNATADQRVLHQKCRIEQDNASDAKMVACKDFGNFKNNSWNVPVTDAQKPPEGECNAYAKESFTKEGTGSAGNFIEENEDFVEWQVGQWQTYLVFHKRCKNETSILKRKVRQCSLSQRQLELDACSLYTLKNSQCDGQFQCIQNAKGAITSDCATILNRTVSRKVLCIHALETVCIIENMFKVKDANDTAEAIQNIVPLCKNQSSNAASCENYTIVCPSSPTPVPSDCQVPLRPGEEAWHIQEYHVTDGLLYSVNGTTLSADQVHPASATALDCPATGGHVPANCSENEHKVCGTHMHSNKSCACVLCPIEAPVGTADGCVANPAPTPPPTPTPSTNLRVGTSRLIGRLVFEENGTCTKNCRWYGGGSFHDYLDSGLAGKNFTGFEGVYQEYCFIFWHPDKKEVFFYNHYTSTNSYSTVPSDIDFSKVNEALPGGHGAMFINRETGYGRYVPCSKGWDTDSLAATDWSHNVEVVHAGHQMEVMDWTLGIFRHYSSASNGWKQAKCVLKQQIDHYGNQNHQKDLPWSKFVDPWFKPSTLYARQGPLSWSSITGEAYTSANGIGDCVSNKTGYYNKIDLRQVDKFFSLGHDREMVHLKDTNVWSPRQAGWNWNDPDTTWDGYVEQDFTNLPSNIQSESLGRVAMFFNPTTQKVRCMIKKASYRWDEGKFDLDCLTGWTTPGNRKYNRMHVHGKWVQFINDDTGDYACIGIGAGVWPGCAAYKEGFDMTVPNRPNEDHTALFFTEGPNVKGWILHALGETPAWIHWQDKKCRVMHTDDYRNPTYEGGIYHSRRFCDRIFPNCNSQPVGLTEPHTAKCSNQ